MIRTEEIRVRTVSRNVNIDVVKTTTHKNGLELSTITYVMLQTRWGNKASYDSVKFTLEDWVNLKSVIDNATTEVEHDIR